MIRILEIEWLKLKKYRAFYVLSALMVVGVFGANFIVFSSAAAFKAKAVDPVSIAMSNAMIGNYLSFPDVFQTVAYISGFMLVLPGLMMIMLMSNEFAFRTSRQNVIDGLSRNEFVVGKVLIGLLIGVAVTALVFIAAMIFGLSGDAPFSLKNVKYIGYFFIQSLSYMSVAMVIAMLVKKAGIATGIYFIYAFVAENLISFTIDHKISTTIAYLLPLKSADKLIPPPTTINILASVNIPDQMWLIFTALAWIALCVWFCKYRFAKSDL